MLIKFSELPIPFGRLALGAGKFVVTEEWLREVFSQAVSMIGKAD